MDAWIVGWKIGVGWKKIGGVGGKIDEWSDG